MSGVSLTSLISLTPTIQSRYDFLAPSLAELSRCSWGGRLGVIRGEKDLGILKSRNRVVAKAGIGRYSGAVHGSNTRRARRRRPPLRPDGCDEDSSGDESDSAVQGQGLEMDTTYDELGMDGAIQDDTEPATDLTDSHQRYLSELRIIQNVAGREYQREACNRVEDGSTWVSIGSEGDLGYQQVDTVSVSNNVEDYVNGAWEEGGLEAVPGSDGDGSGKVVTKIKVDSNESTDYLAEVEPVAATVVSNPERFLEQSLKEVEGNVNSVTGQGGTKPDSFIQHTENSYPDEKDMYVLSISEVSRKSRKSRRKTKKKSGMNTYVPAELPINGRQVRFVEGEAEQPSNAQTSSLNQRGRRKKGDNVAVSALVELETTAKAVTEPEECDDSGMAKDLCEAFETGDGTEECVIVPKVQIEELLTQEGEILSVSMTEPSEVSKQGPSEFGFLGTEQIYVVGERSQFVDAEAEKGVFETDIAVEAEDKVNIGQTEIEVSANVTRKGLSNSTVLESRSSMKSLNNEFCDTSSMVSQKGPTVLTLSIGAENVQSADPLTLSSLVVEQAVSKVAELHGQVASKVAELPTQFASKVVELPTLVASKVVELPAQIASKVVELPGAVAEQVTQVGTLVVEQVADTLADAVTEQVGQVVSQVVDLQTQISDQFLLVGQMMVNQAAEAREIVVDQVSVTAEQVVQVAESFTSTANQVVDQVTEKVTDILSLDEGNESDSEDEFESYKTSDDPTFRGSRGLANFVILLEDQGVLAKIYDFYTYMLKQPMPKFAAAMFTAPIIVSVLFTLLYLPEYRGLAFDDTVRDFFAATYGDALTLQISWRTVFQVFMFSLSLSTGLQPELAPMSPYTQVLANINALVAQLVFVFLSGAVFARLSQPAQPVRCSTVALVSTSPAQRKHKDNAIKVLMTRYVLAGPQPCELVDVKVDLTYKYNTITRTGSYFRATQSLKLVRPEISFLTHGMLVRHVIDGTSPLYQRSQEMLKEEDAVFVLSVVGLERSSMQSIFHVQHYCVCDNDVIWNAEFEDLILINSKKDKRIVDHSRLSMWRSIKT